MERCLAELGHRLRLLPWSVRLVALTTASLVMFVRPVVDLALITVWVGHPDAGRRRSAVTRWLADLHRRYAGALLGARSSPPYLRGAGGSLLVRIAGARGRSGRCGATSLWLFLDGTVGPRPGRASALVEGVLDLLFWWLPPGAGDARACPAGPRVARRRRRRAGWPCASQQLTESRAETVDTQAAELRRIERDLHDGAQARLVVARHEPRAGRGAARRATRRRRAALLAEARAASSAALAELRDLVRGIHPPVLADRGLVGAVQALALAAPFPVDGAADTDRAAAARRSSRRRTSPSPRR